MKYIVKDKINLFLLWIVMFIPIVLMLSCDDGYNYTGPWQEVSTPGGEGELRSCYFNSPTDGWATGIDGDGGDMIFIHWDGNIWEEYQYPGWFDSDGNVTVINLGELSFSSPDDGWCTGSVKFSDRDGYSFILRYDGNDWYVFDKYYEGGMSNIFAISSDDVWITYYISGGSGSDLYHWNGTEMEFYNLPGNYGLTDIAFGSSNEGLAVGLENFIFHWDGVNWEWIDDYNFGHDLEAVAYDTPTSAWIVGAWTVARWKDGEYHYPFVMTDGGWSGIHFSAPDEGWMYGTRHADEDDIFGYPATWHWDGVEWTIVEKPDDMRAKDIFSIDYDNAWIVGLHLGPYCCAWRYQVN